MISIPDGFGERPCRFELKQVQEPEDLPDSSPSHRNWNPDPHQPPVFPVAAVTTPLLVTEHRTETAGVACPTQQKSFEQLFQKRVPPPKKSPCSLR